MPTITNDIDFEVFCSCGNGLCNQTTVEYNRGVPYITIKPCDRCLEKAVSKGYDEGRADGYEEGYDEGLGKGREEGYARGYHAGFQLFQK